MNKKILFLDMDNVIVDFMSGVSKLEQEVFDAHKEIHGESNLDEIEGIFENQEKDFNKNWKSLVKERKRMRGGS